MTEGISMLGSREGGERGIFDYDPQRLREVVESFRGDPKERGSREVVFISSSGMKPTFLRGKRSLMIWDNGKTSPDGGCTTSIDATLSGCKRNMVPCPVPNLSD